MLAYDLRKTNQVLNLLKGHERTEVSSISFMRKQRSSGSFTGGSGTAEGSDPLLDISNGTKKKTSFAPKREGSTLEEESKEDSN